MLPMDVLDVINVKAKEYDLPSANLAAIVDVESRGQVFATVGGARRPVILFEPHILYRRCSGAARTELVRAGLASKNWNKRLYVASQAGRWKQIDDAARILAKHGQNPEAAYESASFGVGQVMGYHWQSLGYTSFKGFLETVMSGANGQIEIMIQYCLVNGLDDELRDGRWPAFFRGYNGPKWEENGYGDKIEAALLLYGGQYSAPDGMLRMGSKGARVRELQALLVRAGHQVKVDGDFGPATKDALRAFQTAKNLKVDGVYGPETESALSAFRQTPEEKPGQQSVTEVDGVIKGVGGSAGGILVKEAIDSAKESVEGAIPQLQQYETLSDWVGYGITALTLVATGLAIAGAAYAAYAWWQSRQTKEV